MEIQGKKKSQQNLTIYPFLGLCDALAGLQCVQTINLSPVLQWISSTGIYTEEKKLIALAARVISVTVTGLWRGVVHMFFCDSVIYS